MLRNLFIIIILGSFLVFIHCQQKQEPWIPVLEDTRFNYLDTSVIKVLHILDETTRQLTENDHKSVNQSILNAKQSLLILKDYYIPLTKIRQLIYDADRIYYLERRTESKNKLEEARILLQDINEQAVSQSLNEPIMEVIEKIDDCILTLDKNFSESIVKLKNLGNKINLMLFKGDLILSGIKFKDE
jgi:hypothetical protein